MQVVRQDCERHAVTVRGVQALDEHLLALDPAKRQVAVA
jgi:hypothetical protein